MKFLGLFACPETRGTGVAFKAGFTLTVPTTGAAVGCFVDCFVDSRNKLSISDAFFAESTLAIPLLFGVALFGPAGCGVGTAGLVGGCRADLDLKRAKTNDVVC